MRTTVYSYNKKCQNGQKYDKTQIKRFSEVFTFAKKIWQQQHHQQQPHTEYFKITKDKEKILIKKVLVATEK